MLFSSAKTRMVTADEALPGRSQTMPVAPAHTVLGTSMTGPWAEGVAVAYFGMGCFWGAEKAFWKLPGVYVTAVGYAAGTTPNPTTSSQRQTRLTASTIIAARNFPARSSSTARR